MKEVAQRHQDKLEKIKKRVQDSYEAFKENYDRFDEFRKFVFESSLCEQEITLLQSLDRPQLEFNVLEAYISRLLGEFSKQEPDIEVSAYDASKADPQVLNIIENHLKHAFEDDDNKHLRYEVYKDLLSGGFSSAKVLTEYEHSMSMEQIIRLVRCEPTLTGFDPLARLAHKGDGRFCYELFPKSKEEFEEEYPEVKLGKLSFTKKFGSFNWVYLNGKEHIILVCDYYEKKRKEETIVQVRDGRVMTMKKYKEMLETWMDFSVPPAIIGKPRKTFIEIICRYRLIDDQIIEYEETDFEMLPIVFIDGHSLLIKGQDNTNIKQMTRPYVYHAKGAQRLKNFAGNSLANQIESIVQHKFMVAKEALPKEDDLLKAYLNVQKESLLVYNSVYEENPNFPIANPIQQVANLPCPPEIAQAFMGADSLIQNVLGSFDASLGINNNQLSGVAIVEAATQSNAAAMPYIVGCLQGFQRLAQIYVNLMPKYFITPRTLPIMGEDGQRQYVQINGEEGVSMEFDTNVLNVSLKAGASFAVQKSRTIMMIKELMGMSPLMAEFMAEKGLNFILDNMEGKGIEELKALTQEWQQEQAQKVQLEQQQQQQDLQNNPVAIKAQVEREKLEHEKEKDELEFQIDLAKLELEKEKLAVDMEITQQNAQMQLAKALIEHQHAGAEHRLKAVDMNKKHAHNHRVLLHEIANALNKGE